MTPLETLLDQRDPRDLAPRVDRLYRFLPRPVARLLERSMRPRHMRSIAPNISFLRTDTGGWTVRKGTHAIAQSQPLGGLVGTIGRPVTIVATGPSVRDHGWDRVRDENRLVIAVNGAPTVLKDFGIRPDLFVVSDNRFAKSGIQHFLNAPGIPLVTLQRAASILAIQNPEQLAQRPFSLIERVNSWYGIPRLPHELLLDINRKSGMPFHFPESQDPNYRIGWSDKPELGYFSGSTVVLVALQIAVSLGATDIEIVGMDLSGAGRAYDEGPAPRPTSLAQQYEATILPSFEIMHQALKERPIRIRNLSPVCPLPRRLFAGE